MNTGTIVIIVILPFLLAWFFYRLYITYKESSPNYPYNMVQNTEEQV